MEPQFLGRAAFLACGYEVVARGVAEPRHAIKVTVHVVRVPRRAGREGLLSRLGLYLYLNLKSYLYLYLHLHLHLHLYLHSCSYLYQHLYLYLYLHLWLCLSLSLDPPWAYVCESFRPASTAQALQLCAQSVRASESALWKECALNHKTLLSNHQGIKSSNFSIRTKQGKQTGF